MIDYKLAVFGLVLPELARAHHLYANQYEEMVVMQTQGMNRVMMAITMMEMAAQAHALLKLAGSALVA